MCLHGGCWGIGKTGEDANQVSRNSARLRTFWYSGATARHAMLLYFLCNPVRARRGAGEHC